ncbi:5-formyltetrahydrofolate cyclo-ligase [Marinomonas mediterranea]|uniref:5-formyltetrahydrofolate cyclo-ligase n=1 Tax=Marinomonas mediterranea (strain ATCC 700492 / JCM 21426 / NBRC 103028 / MMB-1) TaxID=717774 RepID=F2K4H2_MARM1|nr:5-formyltetrahydrofolate cyclo-ligase [Marinomonas mediterranea]ADZ90271.1 5-formyltetrahydrofolate cyclo-ligase [Marinomonas mediterranea MMB-1]WCN16462.1 5-formyltetrahydrofolate cyclo-ligase [Marinomonas mediterranea MMB-1]
MPKNDQRQSLRQELRKKRRALTEQQQDDAASELLNQWYTNQIHLSTQTPLNKIALYLANDGELSPHQIANDIFSRDTITPQTTLYLPALNNDKLLFAHYSKSSEWHTNRFGIEEPVDENALLPNQLDLVFLPLVGFDEQGGRLGMGGGFYDKSFAQKKPKEKPLLIGLAHECQKVNQLPIASWDVPLDGILTPERFIWF